MFAAAGSYPLELVVIDDGSTDRTAAILENLGRKHSFILIHQPNAGLAAALNRGFAEVSGIFVSWTSADNCYLKGSLERLADYLLTHPDVALAYANVQLIDASGKPATHSRYRPQDQDPQDSSRLLLPLAADTLAEINDNFINACFMYRRTVVWETGNYRSDLLGFEDYDYWLRIHRSNNIAHIDSDEILYRYRLHQHSLSAQLKADELHHAQYSAVETTRGLRKLKSITPFLPLYCELLADSPAAQAAVKTLEQVGYSVVKQSASKVKDEIYRLGYQEEPLASTSSSGPDYRAIKQVLGIYPSCFFSATDFSHRSHLCRLLVPSTPSIAAAVSAGEKISAAKNCSVILPALNLSPALLRSRDSFYQAVLPPAKSNGVILVFPPDSPSLQNEFEPDNSQSICHYQWSMSVLKQCVTQIPDFTWVFYCNKKRQSASIQSLIEGTNNAKNIVLIDSSDENQNSLDGAGLSLLYVLSSVDVVFSAKSPKYSIASMLELRVEAALAAAAGISIVSLTEKPPPIDKCTSQELCCPEISEARAAAAVAASVFPIPHLSLVYCDSSCSRSLSFIPQLRKSIKQQLKTAGIFPHPSSLDDYLASTGCAYIGSKLLGMLLSDLA